MKNFPKNSNKLSWSNTRITLLEYCEKKYFLNYYTFALKKRDQKIWETTQQLKKLKSLEMRMGEKTHFLISEYLQLLQNNSASKENIQKLKDKIAWEMEEEFLRSKNKDYSKLNFNDQWGLSEHFYKENIDDQLQITIERVEKNLEQLIHSEWIDKIKPHLQQKNTYIENPRNPNFEAMKIETKNIKELQDINIMASPDFGVFYYPYDYIILDWKSGKTPLNQVGISDQIKVYALKILLKNHQKPELKNFKIQGYEIYLPNLQNYWGTIQQNDIDEIIKKITEDIKFQKQFLINQDPLLNQPLDSKFFSRTHNIKKCETCTFRKACKELENIE